MAGVLATAALFVWAHRGASVEAPENTMAAFRAARAAGADGIELDVHLSRDGVPVVIHDENIDRTTDGFGPVGSLTVAELGRLDAGCWFAPAFAGERLPLLDEVLTWAGSSLRINIEIKTAAAGAAVLASLQRHPASRVLISSFDHRLLARIRAQDVIVPLGFLCESRFWGGALRRAIISHAESFHPRVDRLSRPLLAACREAGLLVYPWVVDTPRGVAGLARQGVDGFFTNDPRLFATGSAARRGVAPPCCRVRPQSEDNQEN